MIKVLHLGNEISWRGGENQIRLLIENSPEDIKHFVAYPKTSRAFNRFNEVANCYPMASLSPYSIQNILGLIKFCKENKIDIIDAHSSGGHSLAVLVKTFYRSVKLVVHRRVAFKIKTNRYKKYLNPKVDHFVAISKAIKKNLLSTGLAENKISVIYSAVCAEPYAHLDKANIKEQLLAGRGENKIIIGNASAMTEEKGYQNLIEALKILKDQGLNFLVFFAGDGTLKSELEQMVKNFCLESSVKFLGHIQNIPEFLFGLDIFVMPSLNEGLGTVLIDASLAGCAICSTRVGGIPEVVVDGSTGLLSEPGNSVALADNIKRLMSDKSLRERLSESARQRALDVFSVKAMVQKNIEVYKSLNIKR